MQKHFYSKVEKVQFLVLVNYQIALKIELDLERVGEDNSEEKSRGGQFN